MLTGLYVLPADVLIKRLMRRLPFLAIVISVTWYWWPSLWGEKIILHGDSAHLFLPLLQLQHNALNGEASLLWTDYFFGGHPIYAEGQGGFANPLNILCAYFFDASYGIGVLHWLSMIVAGLGLYKLCRYQHSSRWAAVAACVIVLFSAAWVGAYHNIAMSVTLAWAPWFLYVTDRWFKSPNFNSSTALAISVVLLVTAGYPQIAHGALLYAFIALITRFLFRYERAYLINNFRRLAVTGVFAILTACCLSAIQIVPLLELSKLSSRANGAELIFAGLTPAKDYLAGIFQSQTGLTASLGNPLIVIIAIGLLLVRITPHATGQILATVILFSFGMEYSSPLFRFFYGNELIPGLHSYRMMHPFFGIFAIGVGAISAYVLTALTRSEFHMYILSLCSKISTYCRYKYAARCLFIVFSCVTLFLLVRDELLSVVIVICLACVAVRSLRENLLSCVAVLALLLLLAVGENWRAFNFYSPDVLRIPFFFSKYGEEIKRLGYRVHTVSASGAFVFMGPKDPDLDVAFRRDIDALSPMAGSLWNIPSISGTLALPMKRWRYAIDQINKEITNPEFGASTPRLLDIMSVRFVASDSTPRNLTLKYFYQEYINTPAIYINNAAKQKFQIYQHAFIAGSTEAAVAAIDKGLGNCLIIEDGTELSAPILRPESICFEDEALDSHVSVVSSIAGKHVLNVVLDKPAWLFVSEANYPGWSAKINGNNVNVYNAQVLGKAIRLPAGISHIEFSFSSLSFRLGAIVSALGSIVLIFTVVIANFRRIKSALLQIRNDFKPRGIGS